MATAGAGRVKHGEKNSQKGNGGTSKASAATHVMGPATGGRLGNKLSGGFIAGRKAKGKA